MKQTLPGYLDMGGRAAACIIYSSFMGHSSCLVGVPSIIYCLPWGKLLDDDRKVLASEAGLVYTEMVRQKSMSWLQWYWSRILMNWSEIIMRKELLLISDMN